MTNQLTSVLQDVYPKDYRASGFWKIALYLCCALVAVGGVAGLAYGVVGQFHYTGGRIVVTVLSLAFTALSAYLLLWLLKSKVLLYPDRIEFFGVFTTRIFTREELRGWRILPTSPPSLLLQPKEGRSFKTGLVFPVDDTLSNWFDAIPSLDQEEAEASEAKVQAEVQNDEHFGVTPSEKTETLQKGRNIAKILSSVSVAACVWAIVYPRPYEPMILLLVILPWIAVEMMRRSHGLFRADQLKNDAHPNVASALIFPAMALCVRGLLDYDVQQSVYAAALYLAIGGAFFAAILVFDPTQRRRIGIIPVFLFIAIGYGYGVIVETNALLDRLPGTVYTATVQNKQISSGSYTTYKLDLSPWGPKTRTNELDVSHATYMQIQTGQVIQLRLKKGALGVHWYYLSDW